MLSVEEAVRKLTSLPADVLSLKDRGRLSAGAYADIVIFDPGTFQDHSTYERPMQYATGVADVFINGRLALKDGQPTGAATGRVVRGRACQGCFITLPTCAAPSDGQPLTTCESCGHILYWR